MILHGIAGYKLLFTEYLLDFRIATRSTALLSRFQQTPKRNLELQNYSWSLKNQFRQLTTEPQAIEVGIRFVSYLRAFNFNEIH